jgi:hypothetical protein
MMKFRLFLLEERFIKPTKLTLGRTSVNDSRHFQAEILSLGRKKLALDKGPAGFTMYVSPPIPFRIEWADSQGNVTASWLAAHFIFSWFGDLPARARVEPES